MFFILMFTLFQYFLAPRTGHDYWCSPIFALQNYCFFFIYANKIAKKAKRHPEGCLFVGSGD